MYNHIDDEVNKKSELNNDMVIWWIILLYIYSIFIITL